MRRIAERQLIERAQRRIGVEQVDQSAPKTKAEREAALLAHLVAAGYARAEPDVLQPASIFLDLSGEDIRGRIFLTTDANNTEYCLRPEYTIPVCRQYLASDQAGQVANFSYKGPVFRQRHAGPVEFYQAGIESFGRTDREPADAEILTTAIAGASAAGAEPVRIAMGDAGLLTGFLEKLEINRVWLRRIKRGIMRHQPLEKVFEPPASTSKATDHTGVLTALEGVDRKGAQALVEDLLSIAGISSVSGRSASDIAERFLEQSSLKSETAFSPEKRQLIEAYLKIGGDPDSASTDIRTLCTDAGIDMDREIDDFDARTGFIAARGFDVTRISFSASFARNLDYYTGFVFEAYRSTDGGGPVAAGGRYDGLLKALGAHADIPAVGAAIWCDRLNGDHAPTPAETAEDAAAKTGGEQA
ncbi:MAG: ATP phosphoribosyltransferase regulatory subunit [Hyphomicrobiales bacterium]|nr:ATP phosphoribosyltransferase regulatory subunit [Hyphomicrobiales bacterium]